MDTIDSRTFRSAILVAVALASIGCARIDGNDVIMQADKILAEAYPACSVVVNYKGIGEGDSDTAYARVALVSRNNAAPVDTEIQLVRSKSEWRIAQAASAQLVSEAGKICNPMGSGE